MNRAIELGILGALVAAGFVATYFVVFDESAAERSPRDDDDGVAVYAAAEDELRKVTWETEDRTLVLEPREDELGDWIQITLTTREEQAPPPTETPPTGEPDGDDTDVSDVSDLDGDDADDEGMDDTDSAATEAGPPDTPEPVVVTETETFVGNDLARELWEDFAPFEADRKLEASALEGVDLGMDDPHGTLTVERRAGPVTLTVGGTTYGDRAYYLRSGDETYLLAKRALSRLDGAAAGLRERRLQPLDMNEIAQVTLTRGDETVTWVHNNRNDRAEAHFARESTPDQRDDAATTLMPNILRLTSAKVVPEDEAPDDLRPVLTANATDGDARWVIAILESPSEPGAYWARSPLARSLVTLIPSQVKEVLADLDPVFGDEDDAEGADDGDADDEDGDEDEDGAPAPVDGPPE
jgi:hypothetical protein